METTLPLSLASSSRKYRLGLSFFGERLSGIDYILIGALTFILALQLHLQFIQKINWDEFFYLSHIYEAQNGTLDKILQMGHVYLFDWLTHIPGGEMVQITVGRIVMWAVQLGTLCLIIGTARKFLSLTAALFAGLCFLGLGFVFLHGTSFRADPLAALCMMYAVYVFIASELRHRDLVALSAALAIGMMLTVKVMLFAPLLAILAVWRLGSSTDKKSICFKFAVAALGAVLLFVFAVAMHRTTLTVAESGVPSMSLSSKFQTAFLSGDMFPRRAIMRAGLITGLLPSLLIILGAIIATHSAVIRKGTRITDLITLALALPLVSFIFYRNAYPYFYAFIFPPSVILAGYAIYKLKFSKLFISVLSLMMTLNIGLLYAGRIDDTRQVQQDTLKAVHMIFPAPVTYFDRSAMVSSFPKAGLFMSGWGLKTYHDRGEPRFFNEMERQTVPLLIDNSPVLGAAIRGNASGLLEQDAAALKDNFIPHWGHIWVAGKVLQSSPEPTHFSILVPGTYTIESEANVSINNETYPQGGHVYLKRGSYAIASQVSQRMTLRWGKDLHRPVEQASTSPIFGAF